MTFLHGIRASSSERGGSSTTSWLLTQDNYTEWRSKMEALLLDYHVWDLVSGTRIRPDPPTKARIVFGEAHENQAAIDAANDNVEDFEDAYMIAACLIAISISDSEIWTVRPVLENPVATWKVLRNIFATRSDLGAEAARMAPLQHVETKTARQGSPSSAPSKNGGASGGVSCHISSCLSTRAKYY